MIGDKSKATYLVRKIAFKTATLISGPVLRHVYVYVALENKGNALRELHFLVVEV